MCYFFGGKSVLECFVGWYFGLCWVVLDIFGLSVMIVKLVRWVKFVIFFLSVIGVDE